MYVATVYFPELLQNTDKERNDNSLSSSLKENYFSVFENLYYNKTIFKCSDGFFNYYNGQKALKLLTGKFSLF